MALVEWFVQAIRAHWAAYLISFQVVLNVFGVGLIFCMAIYRKGSLKKSSAIIPVLHERVTDICCGMNLDIADLKALNYRDRIVVRGLILKALESVSGTYRENLSRLYSEMGFLSEDRQLLLNKSFAKRLAALSRIDILEDVDSGFLISKMLNDPSPYVHFAALKFLLKIKYPKLHVNIDKELNKLVSMNRMDTAAQILEMFAISYSEEFLTLLSTHKNRQVINMCLEVVLRLHVAEALPIVKDQMIDGLRCEGFPEFEEFDFRRYTMCLTVVPDEEAEDLLLRMTDVNSPSVRNFAYLALLKIRPDLKAELTARLSEDESPQGRRLYLQLSDARNAA
ncbi:hypothetical protein ACLSU7_05980 [Bdellovibrio sp. HCB185ZH]|uniref:hypothetical protein n=1 Tax=Bdellovibrio sp. HCB185ZH TaxID=3394235 RepID=UPI0039A638E1